MAEWEIDTNIMGQMSIWDGQHYVVAIIGSHPDARANATLIVSAPEMLAALKLLDEWVQPYEDMEWMPGFAETVQIARAAIAKAEGRDA